MDSDTRKEAPADVAGEAVIGKRDRQIKESVNIGMIIWIAICAFWGFACLTPALEPGADYISAAIACMIFVVAGAIPGRLVLIQMRDLKLNERCMDPAITLRSDGAFVLHHPNGKKDILDEGVQDVRVSKNHWIIFFMDASMRIRTVKYVKNASAVVANIMGILSDRSSGHVLTNFEKTKLFCPYCGTRLSVTDMVCSHCGSRRMQ